MPDSPPPPADEDAAQVLLEAEAAATAGDRPRAYRLSLEAAQADPQNLQAWLLCAGTAPTLPEAAACLNQANTLQPEDPQTRHKTYQLVQELLAQDPFLRYQAETEAVYQLSTSQRLALLVPKDRAVPPAYPQPRPAPLQKAYRWLGWAFLGLPLAGLGALVFAPLAAAAALGLYFQTASRNNRIYSLVVVLLSGGLWLVGLLLAVILLLHLV